jgi:hypothetical protein
MLDMPVIGMLFIGIDIMFIAVFMAGSRQVVRGCG